MAEYVVRLNESEAACFLDLPVQAGFSPILVQLMQRQIRAQIPKPVEPTEFGAMVKDRDGARWVLAPVHYHERPWVCEAEQFRADYDLIDVVEVLR